MSTPSPASATAPSAGSTTRERRRILIASFIGTAIEFYDFYIYGTAAALVFGTLFFPSFSPTAGTLAALATFAVGFIARPLGAGLFGHWGDRLGRKSMLIASLLIMGGSTVAVGLVPTFATWGVWAPITLVVLRFLQGVGLGGEWGGAVLMATEHAPPGKRGLYSAFPQLGPAVGFILGNLFFLGLSSAMTAEEFQAYGWRIPFLASAVLLVIGFYIRMTVAESPIFAAAVDKQERARVPVADLVREQPRVLVLATLSFVLAHTLFYTVTTFCLSYGTTTLGLPRTTMLIGALVAAAVMGVATLYFATVSDRLGRRRVCLAAAAGAALWAFPLFWLIDTRDPLLTGIGLTGGLFFFGVLYGPMGAFLPELFRVRYRYSGASLAYSLAGIVGGGVSPLVATNLLATTGQSWPISLYLAGIAVVCFVAVLLLRETRSDDYTDGLLPPAAARPSQQLPVTEGTP